MSTNPLLPIAPTAPFETATTTTGLLFIDPTVQNYHQLLSGLQTGITPVLLDANQDGIQQITTVLTGRTDITSVHILSHGFQGGVKLGNSLLTVSTLDQYTSQLQAWQSALAPSADILFYGCNVGAAGVGNAFLSSIANLTGADIAASTDLTGTSSLDGNWDLEVSTGFIEAPLAFQIVVLEAYTQVLPLLEQYTFTGALGTATSVAPDGQPTNGTLSNMTEGSGLTNTGIPANDVFWANGWQETSVADAIIANDYFEFTIQANPGFVLTLDDLQFQELRSATGPTNFSVRSSLDGYTTDLLTTTTATVLTSRTVTLGGASFTNVTTPITFRFYAWGASAAIGTWRIDNVQINGSIVTTSPVVTLVGILPQYAENQAAVVIADAATVTDADSANFNTGTLTVRFTAGGIASDRLTIAPNATVTLNGQRISVGGIEIATFRGGFGTAEDLVITLNANATPARTQDLLRRIAYSNAGDALPTTGSRTVEFVLVDDTSNASTAVTRTIDIITLTNNNDAPIIGNRTILYDGSLGGAPSALILPFIQNPAGAVTPVVGGGGVTIDTTSNFGISAGYFGNPFVTPVLNRTNGYTLSFTAQVLAEARAATANKNNDGKDDRAGFSVIVLSSDAQGIELGFWTDRIWAQDDGTTQTDPSLEPDDAPLDNTRTLFTQAEFNNTVDNTVLRNYDLTILGNTYSLFADGILVLSGRLRNYTAFNKTPDPYETANLIFFGDNTPSAQARFRLNAISITTNTALPAQTVAEDTPLVVTNIQIADVDASPNNVTVTLTAPNGTLTVNNAVVNGVSAGNITNNGTTTVTLVGTVSQINTTLANATGLIYQGVANFNGTETLTVTVNDGGNTGGGAQTASRTKTITVTAINDAPTVTAPAAIAVIEDQASPLTGISFADVDAGAGIVTATFTVGAGTLAATTGGGVTVGGTTTNRTLSGTLANINAFLAAGNLTYTTVLDSVVAQTLGVSINDGGNTGIGGALGSGVTNVTLNVTAVNDPPSFANLGNQTLAPGTNTPQTVPGWANTFVFGPADEAGQAVDAFLVSVTSDPNNIFTTAPAVANNGTLTYTPNGTAGTATVEVRLRDNGGTANGGIDLSPVTTFTITVNAAAPTLAIAPGITPVENTSTNGTLTLNLSQAVPAGGLTVNFTLAGSATLGTDYTLIPGTGITAVDTGAGTFTIAAGATTATLIAQVIDDLAAEPNETILLTMTAVGGGYTLGTTAATLTIAANDTTVTTTNDAGEGSLRQAVINANAFAGADTINFFLPAGAQTISLLTALPDLTDDVDILNTTGAANLTIRADILGAFDIFTVNNGVIASFDQLTLSNGRDGIRSQGTIASLSNSIISGNQTNGISNLSVLTALSNSTITGNQANGILNFGTLTTLTDTTISGNLRGIYNQAGTIVTLSNSTLSGNQSQGILNDAVLTTLSNTTLSGNQLVGIFNIGTIDLINNATIALNGADGINNPGTITTLSNSIVAGHTNNLSNNAPGTQTNNQLGTLAQVGLSPTLANNGGPTQTHALLPGSPAIDAAGAGATTTDQRGIAAVGTRDIGAFESRQFTIATTGGTPQSTLINTAFANPLGIQVTSAFGEPVAGGVVTYTPPAAGASATLSSLTATLNATGAANVTATANGTAGGPYIVTAGGNGITNTVDFSLTNTLMPNTTPTLVAPLPPVTVAENAPPTTIDLLPFFADAEDSSANLTYTILSNSNPALFTADILNGLLTLTYALNTSGTADLVIRATDTQGAFVDSPFTVTVIPLIAPPPPSPTLSPGLTHLTDLGGVEGVYQVGGNPGDQIVLQVDWVFRDAAFNNELGYFIADDAQGTINGIAPGNPTYARTALTSAGRRILFRSGETAGIGIDITVTVGQFLVFYLVQDTSTDNWLATNPSNASTGRRVLFSRSLGNPGQVDQVRDRTLAPGVLELAWEDLASGGDQDFNDAIVRIGPAAFPIPGTTGITPLRFDWITREARFNNELGCFFVDDINGRIGTLRPGDPGYLTAAFSPGNFQVIFASGQGQGASTSLSLPAGRFLGWYIIQNASTADFVLRNLANRRDATPLAFFSFLAANPDGVDHFRRVSATEFAFEDLTGSGDRDFNDVVFRVSL
ncbi:MAG: DUF4347 domain-containing protein [Cyanobacteria bacterium]|nr:DUF4347 domain-containing protein [Cyanobacteriota bacterium]MDW8201310.1 DUF4347 domain-containing protein [Cyanobacteriota bacterium SKYGB_h_bin112]